MEDLLLQNDTYEDDSFLNTTYETDTFVTSTYEPETVISSTYETDTILNATYATDTILNATLANVTSASELLPPEHHLEVVVTVICCIAILANALIIYTIVHHQPVISRTNLTLLNFCINNIVSMLATPVVFLTHMDLSGEILSSKTLFCLLADVHASAQTGCFLFMGILVSQRLITTNKLTNRHILIATYGFVILSLLINTYNCATNIHPVMFLIPVLLIFICLCIAMGIKELTRCFQQHYCTPDKNSKVRFNIGRIYLYTWLNTFIFTVMIWTCLYKNEYLIVYMHYFEFLCPVYILIYLCMADYNFKECLISICCLSNPNLDGAIFFAKELNDL